MESEPPLNACFLANVSASELEKRERYSAVRINAAPQTRSCITPSKVLTTQLVNAWTTGILIYTNKSVKLSLLVTLDQRFLASTHH